jgi:siroheme synthase (precorrin-2 oxidase/ferrochelatase)
LGPEYAAFLEIMRELRPRLAREFPDFQQRRAVWYRLAESPALQLLRENKPAEARAAIEALIAAES